MLHRNHDKHAVNEEADPRGLILHCLFVKEDI